MKNILTASLVLFCFVAKSQFAFINDKDGFVNVRANATGDKNITDTLKKGHLVFYFGNTGNWTEIDYDKVNRQRHGYVYKDRYTPIQSLPVIPVIKQSTSTITLAKDSIEIMISETAFIKTNHRYKYYSENQNAITLIDGKPYWGTDGGVPSTQYQYIKIKAGLKQLVLPKTAFENLFEPNLHSTGANYEPSTGTLYIHSLNSDGAGSYWVIWKIVKGVYMERYIAYGF